MADSKEIIIRFRQYILDHNLLNKNDRVLLAVSGGIDSTVMCDLFTHCDFKIGIAHCNFKLRETHSEADEKFVEQLAKKYQVPFFPISFYTGKYSEEKGISTQMAARELRYQWLERVRKEHDFYYIATAHHKNDNVETVLLNLVKGTGIAGLHGILPKSGKLIRPMLHLTKEEIQHYTLDYKISYREDHTNAESVYQRNKLRLEVIPRLQEINPSFIETFSNNIEKFKDAELIFEKGLNYYRKKLINYRDNEIYISIKKLKLMPGAKTILYRILNEHSFNESQSLQIFNALNAEAGTQFLSNEFRVIKDRDFLIISKKEDALANYVLVNDINKNTKLKDCTLHYHLKKNKKISFDKNPGIAYLDYSKLQFPLTIRSWKRGDYFYPFGRTKKTSGKVGKRKISNFFTDLKLSILDKERIWIMESGKKIVWVIGYRIDDRFKVTASTEQVLVIKKKGK